MSITYDDIVGTWAGHKDLTPERRANIRDKLLPAVQALEHRMSATGFVFLENPKTMSIVSGQTYGGFRPQDCPIGAPKSNHKEGFAVDIYDPDGEVDSWCLRNLSVLEECGIWIESPSKTQGWSHWQAIAPRSGRRVYAP